MNWTAELTLSPYVKKVKSGFGEYRMVDEHNAIKAMEQHAEERSIAFGEWVDKKARFIDASKTYKELYSQFLKESALSTQKEQSIIANVSIRYRLSALEMLRPL